jgi:hypothetical protein
MIQAISWQLTHSAYGASYLLLNTHIALQDFPQFTDGRHDGSRYRRNPKRKSVGGVLPLLPLHLDDIEPWTGGRGARSRRQAMKGKRERSDGEKKRGQTEERSRMYFERRPMGRS